MGPLSIFFASLLLSILPEDSSEDDRRRAVDFVRRRALDWGPEFTRRMREPFPDPDALLEQIWERECLEARSRPDLDEGWYNANELLGGKDEELFKRLVEKYPEVGSAGLRTLTDYSGCDRYGDAEVHTTADSLVTVETPYATRRPVLLHPAAAASFSRVLADPSLTDADKKALCRINSSFRSFKDQQALVRQYEAAIKSKWVPWSRLSEAQKDAARAKGFAYHPGNPPVDKDYTHVGGGALDIDSPLPPRAVAALQAEGWKLDSPGDEVHWGWHGTAEVPAAVDEGGSWTDLLSSFWPFSSGGSSPPPATVPTATVEAAPGASVELVAADGTAYSTGTVPAGTYDAVISGKHQQVTLQAGRTYRASSIGTLYG